jgi:hypothetical protein
MTNQKQCDICSQTQVELQIDVDGLWICITCQKQIKTTPVSLENSDNELVDELKPLVGKSAGAICRTLELPQVPPYEIILKAAARISYDQDHYLGAWHFVTQWQDGTTIWSASDGSATAKVSTNGTVNIADQF